MGSVLWHITMSVDGFIAGPDDDMSWMGAYVGPNETVSELLPRIGALLIGHRTFGIATTPGGAAYGGAITVPQIVLAHDAAELASPEATFAGTVEDAVRQAQSAAGDRYVVVFGAGAAKACLEAGLLDEVLIHIVPVMLGDGVRLFERAGAAAEFETISVTQAGQVTNLWLRVPR